MHKFEKFIFCTLLLLIPTASYPVPATPDPITRVLPDSSELTVLLRGNEFFRYELTLDGYLIRRDEAGFYFYAEKDTDDMIKMTDIRVSPIEKRNEVENLYLQTQKPFPDFRGIILKRQAQRVPATITKQLSFPKTGSPKSIVILINFKDLSFVTPNPKAAFSDMLNREGYSENGGTGSARDYFKTVSNGLSSPEFVVAGPYTLPNTRAYYGANDISDNDIRAREMIIDACTVAANKGVDFSVYDTNQDGDVDNVFIYYAGHNEAEGGPTESIWPHRWVLGSPLVLNGKKIIGYACTSELRGKRGKNMCGIGTFAHEFGHVYGLVDYYPTNSASHHTLSNWDIMDQGAYLNNGRTPPVYSAYNRFALGWLKPDILRNPQHVFLEDIKTSNAAYIITDSGIHNLDGADPDPAEFFLLENRQKTGWDAYLPASGMLITRIYFNKNDWNENAPNNNKNAMGVDIIEADEHADESSLSGDPFPGATNRKDYHPTLRNGIDISRPLTNIVEKNGLIQFDFMGGGGSDMIWFTNKENDINVYKESENGSIILDKGKATEGDNIIYIYTASGQLVRKVESKSQVVIIKDLIKNQMYIIKSGKNSIKIVV